MNNSKPLGLLLAVAAAIAVSSAGGAAPAPESVAVGYADLDLRTANGVATLNKRIRRAAVNLCDRRAVRPLADYLAQQDCVTGTIQTTRPQVEQALAVEHRSRLAAREQRPAESR
jgi:UrcA family protein